MNEYNNKSLYKSEIKKETLSDLYLEQLLKGELTLNEILGPPEEKKELEKNYYMLQVLYGNLPYHQIPSRLQTQDFFKSIQDIFIYYFKMNQITLNNIPNEFQTEELLKEIRPYYFAQQIINKSLRFDELPLDLQNEEMKEIIEKTYEILLKSGRISLNDIPKSYRTSNMVTYASFHDKPNFYQAKKQNDINGQTPSKTSLSSNIEIYNEFLNPISFEENINKKSHK